MPEPMPVLRVESLVVRFPVLEGSLVPRYLVPVHRVSFSIAEGEAVALVGESGSGKTTLGRAILRLLEPHAGRILLEGRDVTRVGGRALKEYWRHVQMIFQDPFGSLNPVRTVEQHLVLPFRMGQRSAGQPLFPTVEELLARVGLTPPRDILGKYPHELSGGQRQRVGIARAIAVGPRLIVADEPISMLDVSIRAGILHLMKELQRSLRVSFLYITHDLPSARYFGDRIMVMYAGRIVEVAPASALIAHPVHPYTLLLLASTPGSAFRHLAQEVSERPPNLLAGVRGCPFAERCPLVQPVCRQDEPQLEEKAPGHWVACHVASPTWREAVAANRAV